VEPAVSFIREYYRRIDASDTDWVLALFAPDAVYQRADATYRGAEQLRRFFCVERQIRGSHSLEHLWDIGPNVVAAVGSFEGVGVAGDSRCVRFADIWWFNAEQRVARRETFLALGNSYVRA
jgi:ketosteroid isomerase-like protein